MSKNKIGWKVHIFAYKVEENLIFGIRNTGSLVTNNADKNRRKGIGLENIKKRLELNYGLKECFKIFEIDKMVSSEVCFPIKIV